MTFTVQNLGDLDDVALDGGVEGDVLTRQPNGSYAPAAVGGNAGGGSSVVFANDPPEADDGTWWAQTGEE